MVTANHANVLSFHVRDKDGEDQYAVACTNEFILDN